MRTKTVYLYLNRALIMKIRTSFPKVICEEGRVAAPSRTYAAKAPLVTMARPKFAPKSTPSRGPIAKPHHPPHPWIRPTYDTKRHPDPMRRISTMHWTDRQTDRPTAWPIDRSQESLTIGRCASRATRPNNTAHRYFCIQSQVFCLFYRFVFTSK